MQVLSIIVFVLLLTSSFCLMVQGWWSTGFSYGLWIASLVASGFSVVPVASQTWKAYFGLTRSESPKVCYSCYIHLSFTKKKLV
jgi:hypothetical protein